MSTKTTTVLSKEEIVSKLEGLHFSFEEHHWDSFLQSFSEVKPAQASSAPRVSAKAIAIPVMALLGGIIIYFSVNTLKSQNTTDNSKVSIETATAAPLREPETSADTKASAPVTETKQEAVPVNTNSAASNTSPAPVVTPAASTVTAPVNNPVAGTSAPAVVNTVSAATNTNPTTTTRFYRKRRTAQEQTPAAPVPSPEEDDVVVPQN